MTNDKIEEIRARHEEGIRAGADDDRAALLAEVERLTRELNEARAALRWYADHRNHYPVLHHRRSGDPDPVAVFVEEPPIMTDGGRRAREALEAKP